jgi:hypothetical protein
MDVVALPPYTKHIRKLLSSDERLAMESNIAADPLAYPVMKARWARGIRGKSAGIRAVFRYYVSGGSIYMLDAYPKNQKENLTDAEKNDLRNLAQAIEREGSR